MDALTLPDQLFPALIALTSSCFYALGLVMARKAVTARPVVVAASVSLQTAASLFWLKPTTCVATRP